ncbi:hypothetical protein [Arcanobacterium hippocoleae]|uniref:O-antigen ligase n=1 Tax=Arcanobacterium hippocoleae TaxID=149017 RepID=A0ABU1T006_9ACTO|nr:hypothetical protein [Arcanobacterium hippocoleae]MDR6938629.1 O-antigen ligase [Arcanobacterium hippocoleae]
MRVSTTIFGIFSLILGMVAIWAGMGGSINMRMLIVCFLAVLAVILGVAALLPAKPQKTDDPEENLIFARKSETPQS